MPYFTCDVGDIARIKTVFTDADTGGVVDPTEVYLYLLQPTGSEGTFTYSSGSITRQAQGTYYYLGTITESGYWNARWQGSGAAVAASQGRFFAREVNT